MDNIKSSCNGKTMVFGQRFTCVHTLPLPITSCMTLYELLISLSDSPVSALQQIRHHVTCCFKE